MKKNWLLILLICLIVAAVMISSCGPAEEEEESKDGDEWQGTGEWYDKWGEPEYGGTMTYRRNYLRDEFGNHDWRGRETRLVFEDLLVYDWTVDPEEMDFSMVFVPYKYFTGNLAESWEHPDAQTYIFHIREGVHFHNKPPVNGRELTAYDIEKHYARLLGTGYGYTEELPMYGGQIKCLRGSSITATDKYTVEFKFLTGAALNIYDICRETGANQIEAPETVSPGQNADWTKAIGTGPFILDDFVTGSSATYVKNPDYWRYDPRYPKNKLPYFDEVKILCIPDTATAMSALRTGKIDFLDGLLLEQSSTLLKTNPELLDSRQWNAGPSLEPRVDIEPFSDIRVRKAMQMAIDLEAISGSFYGGEVPPIPCGPVNSAYKGMCIPYAQWPQELKDEYSYNPEKARELLADAGYAGGFDTTVQADSGFDLLQVFKAYFLDIGINMEIQTLEPGAMMDIINARQHTIRWDYFGRTGPNTTPFGALGQRITGTPSNENEINDPVFDDMYDEINTTPDYDEAVRLIIEADQHALRQHWGIFTFPIYKHTVYQPYLKGYNGVYLGRYPGPMYAMWWIDQDLKQSTR